MDGSTSFKIETTGLSETLKMLERFNATVTHNLTAALYQVAEEVMSRSVNEQVPVHTGNLKSTGHVQEPKITQNEASVSLGYGGTAANGEEVDYAFFVHEDMSAHHAIGKAKYLEDPLTEAMGELDKRLAEAVIQSFR